MPGFRKLRLLNFAIRAAAFAKSASTSVSRSRHKILEISAVIKYREKFPPTKQAEIGEHVLYDAKK